VDLRAGLDDLEKRKFLTLPGLELRHLGLCMRKRKLEKNTEEMVRNCNREDYDDDNELSESDCGDNKFLSEI
jgi:hypothetical protein